MFLSYLASIFCSSLFFTLEAAKDATNYTCTPPRARDLMIFGSSYGIQYYSNVELDQNTNIYMKPTNLIFSQHGASRNADDYYCAMYIAAQMEGYTVDYNGQIDIIIIAPRFMELSDNPNKNELYWGEDWKGGSNSIVTGLNDSLQVSSFTVYDKIIELMFYNHTKYYPNLVNISVAGHSAGGQFVQRYALVSTFSFENYDKLIAAKNNENNNNNNNSILAPKTEKNTKNTKNMKNDKNNNLETSKATTTNTTATKKFLKYIVANPSSFCYLSSKRWFDNSVFRELTTNEINACPDYNAWKYGWSQYKNITFPPYITTQDKSFNEIKLQYKNRNVTYLQGTYDVCNSIDNTTCDDHDMDTGCEADLQGEFRLERGMNYIRSLREIYNETVHGIQLVPFVGHDDIGMFQSPNGRRSIFSGHL